MEEKKLKKEIVYGFPLSYEDGTYNGVRYLRDDLQREEARVFFDQARQRGEAQFENDYEEQFTLKYSGGKYELVKR